MKSKFIKNTSSVCLSCLVASLFTTSAVAILPNIESTFLNNFNKRANKSNYPWSNSPFSKLQYSQLTDAQNDQFNELVVTSITAFMGVLSSSQWFNPDKKLELTIDSFQKLFTDYNTAYPFDNTYTNEIDKKIISGSDPAKHPEVRNSILQMLFNKSTTGISDTHSIFVDVVKALNNATIGGFDYQAEYAPNIGDKIKINIKNTAAAADLTCSKLLGYICYALLPKLIPMTLFPTTSLAIAFYTFNEICFGKSDPYSIYHSSFKNIQTGALAALYPWSSGTDPEFRLTFDQKKDDIETQSWLFELIFGQADPNVDFIQNYKIDRDYLYNISYYFWSRFAQYYDQRLTADNLSSKTSLAGYTSFWAVFNTMYTFNQRPKSLGVMISSENTKLYGLDGDNPRPDLYLRFIFSNPLYKFDQGKNYIDPSTGHSFWELFYVPFRDGQFPDNLYDKKNIENAYYGSRNSYQLLFQDYKDLSQYGDTSFQMVLINSMVGFGDYYNKLLISFEYMIDHSGATAEKMAQMKKDLAAIKSNIPDWLKIGTWNPKNFDTLAADFYYLLHNNNNENNNLSIGAIAGIVIGSLVGSSGIATFAYLGYRYTKTKKSKNLKDKLKANKKPKKNSKKSKKDFDKDVKVFE